MCRCPTFSTSVTKLFFQTDIQLIWNKQPFHLLFSFVEIGPLFLLTQNELYCSLLLSLQLDGPLSHFRQMDGQGQI